MGATWFCRTEARDRDQCHATLTETTTRAQQGQQELTRCQAARHPRYDGFVVARFLLRPRLLSRMFAVTNGLRSGTVWTCAGADQPVTLQPLSTTNHDATVLVRCEDVDEAANDCVLVLHSSAPNRDRIGRLGAPQGRLIAERGATGAAGGRWMLALANATEDLAVTLWWSDAGARDWPRRCATVAPGDQGVVLVDTDVTAVVPATMTWTLQPSDP
jgi:hypothetical protein